jgi:hypothetical protein
MFYVKSNLIVEWEGYREDPGFNHYVGNWYSVAICESGQLGEDEGAG